MNKKKKFTISIIALVFILLSGFALQRERAEAPAADTEEVAEEEVITSNYKNIRFEIDGEVVETRYFGNELVSDLDGDGDEDIAFVVTQETGGSGTFFYAVAALKTDDGYEGTDGYLLGDRIAPQSTDISPNPRHKNVVVFNYADRAADEPMTAQPSIGKSVYLKVVPETNRWAIVEPDFEGESAF